MTTKGIRKVHEGIVVSNKMQKSVTVRVDHSFAHRYYNKIIRRSRKYMAHDELNQCAIGDRVRIMEVRPLSKQKNWLVTEILVKAK